MKLVSLEGLPDVLKGIDSSYRKSWEPVGGYLGSIDTDFSILF